MNKLKRRLQQWLEIEKPEKPEKSEISQKMRDTVDKLNRELDFWKRTFRSYSRIPCAHCGKQMHVYPFGGAYYERNGKKVHASCYDEFLKEEAKS